MGAFEKLDASDPLYVGPFRIVARLGEGGMGRVYLGRSKTGRAVAVKVMRPNLAWDRESRRRFAREVSVAHTVSGFFTAGVVAADPDASPPWLATAYVPGISLDRAVSDYGPWPEGSVLALGAGLAEALESIHAAGVVHRDLKPSNVLLSAEGPRVIDFGISVPMEASRLTQTGMAVGTPGFMSPEQLTGDPVGPPSDVFCLGAVLVFTATGTGPFGTGSAPALLYRIVHQEPDLSMLPPMLRSVVARCLAKRPEQRPTASALLDELARRIMAKTSIVEFFAESAWLPADVAQVIRDRVATPLPTPSDIPVDFPRTPPRPEAAEALGAQAAPSRLAVQPAAVPSYANEPEPGAADHPAGGYGGPDLPYRPDGGGPRRGAVTRGRAKTRPARASRRSALRGLAAIGVAAATGVIGWRLLGGGSETEGRGGSAAQPQPTPGDLRWSFTTGGAVNSSPAVVDGVVYVGAGDGMVYAIEAATGRKRWSVKTGGDLGSSPAVVDGVVYVDGGRDVYAIEAATGRKRWSFATRGVVSSPTVVDGVLYAGSGDGHMYAVEATTGRERWSFTTESWVSAPPSVADGVVYVGSGSGRLYAIEAATGRERWSFAMPEYISSSPVVADGVIYVGCWDGKVYALEAATHRKRWSFTTGKDAGSSLAVVDGVVYVGAGDGKVYAVEAATGRERWSLTTGRGNSSTPAVVDGVVYVGGDGGNVTAIDAATGRKSWSFTTGDDVGSSPAVVDGVVYVGSNDGNVYALTAGARRGRKTGS